MAPFFTLSTARKPNWNGGFERYFPQMLKCNFWSNNRICAEKTVARKKVSA
jgi:hypothetical protein